MNLPNANDKNRKQKETLKYCKEPGCGKEYLGHPVTKYCETHRLLKNRVRKKVIYKDIGIDNIIFKHTFTQSTDIVMSCKICNRDYAVTIIPKQQIYPKYCKEHRNEYKREQYKK